MKNILPKIISLGALFLGQIMLFLIGVPIYLQFLYATLFVGIFIGQRTWGYVFVFRVATPVSIGIFFALLYHYAHSIDTIKGVLDASFRVNNLLDRFFNVVSTLYAISIAFLLLKGLTDYDNLKGTLNNESTKIRCLMDYTLYFEGKNNLRHSNKLLALLKKYVSNIFGEDRISNSAKNDIVLRNCIKATSKLEPSDVNDEIALSEIMKGLTDLSAIRSQRQSIIDSKMSPFLLLALLFMSFCIIYPFFTKTPAEAGSAGYIMIFTMTTLLSFMFITMLDLRDPFAGFWKIKLEAFDRLISGEKIKIR